MKRANIQVFGIQKGTENAKGVESMFREITENFSNLEKIHNYSGTRR